MHSRVQSRKLFHVSGINCHVHATTVTGCAFLYLLYNTVAVQHEELINKDLMELEAQREGGERRKEEEVTEELETLMMQQEDYFYLRRY